MKFVEDIFNRFQVTLRAWFCEGQSSKENNLKVKMLELWFLRYARRLMLTDIYMKFREDSLNGFQVIVL